MVCALHVMCTFTGLLAKDMVEFKKETQMSPFFCAIILSLHFIVLIYYLIFMINYMDLGH